jgi:hypothetical protein
MDQFLACLSSDECARIAVGGAGTMEPAYAEDGNEIGGSSTYAQGGAGQTTQAYYLTRHIPVMPNADGPAGIRITQHYWLNVHRRKIQSCTNEAVSPAHVPATHVPVTFTPPLRAKLSISISSALRSRQAPAWP